MDLKGFE